MIWALEAATILGIAVAYCRPLDAQVNEHDGARGQAVPRYSDAVSLHEGRLPPNLVAPEVATSLLTRMWRSSATFRRQCSLLAEHPGVTIRITLEPGTTHGLALSWVDRAETGLNASVQIEMRRPELWVEHLAHELEHVLEQIEGIDLARLARARVDGVINVGGQYETARARWVGRAVAREVMIQ